MVGRWPRWFGMMAISWPQRNPYPQYLGSGCPVSRNGDGVIQKKYDPLVRYLTIPNRSYRILKAVLGFCCLMLEHFINQMVVVGCWLAPLDKYLINCPRPCMFLMFFLCAKAYVCSKQGYSNSVSHVSVCLLEMTGIEMKMFHNFLDFRFLPCPQGMHGWHKVCLCFGRWRDTLQFWNAQP